MIINPANYGPLAWGLSATMHVAAGVALVQWAALLPPGTWKTGVVKGAAVTLHASIATEASPPPAPTVTIVAEPAAEAVSELQPPATQVSRLLPSDAGLLPALAPADSSHLEHRPSASPIRRRAVVAEAVPEVTSPELPTPSPSRSSSAAMAGANAAVAGAADDMPRQLANNPAPEYPSEAIAANWEGRVLILALVSADGSVLRATISRTSGFGSLDAAALKAVKQWRFAPARRQQQAVNQEVLVPVRFRIDRG